MLPSFKVSSVWAASPSENSIIHDWVILARSFVPATARQSSAYEHALAVCLTYRTAYIDYIGIQAQRAANTPYHEHKRMVSGGHLARLPNRFLLHIYEGGVDPSNPHRPA